MPSKQDKKDAPEPAVPVAPDTAWKPIPKEGKVPAAGMVLARRPHTKRPTGYHVCLLAVHPKLGVLCHRNGRPALHVTEYCGIPK